MDERDTADEDSIHVNPNRASTSATPKRHPVARMHASRVSKAQNTGQRNNAVARMRRAGSALPIATMTHIAGKCPPFNDLPCWVDDPFNRKLYMVGGIRPGDDSQTPTSDFYCCDTATMTWTDMTNVLVQRNPYDPFSEEELRRPPKRLPKLSLPGCTLLRIHDSSFIFIFGGFDYITDEATSRVIVIDLEHTAWWYLKLNGEAVNARINPAVVAIDDKLYIFGGYRKFGHDPQPHSSFSIAEYKAAEGIWHWAVRDAPYSNPVPEGHVFGQGISVYNGTKILLTPGRLTNDDPIHFTNDALFFYHTTNKRFQPAAADVTGAFPRQAVSTTDIRAAFLETTSRSSTQRCHSARPNHDAGSTSRLPSIRVVFVIICAWIPLPNTDDIVPEIWHLFLSPDERINCLDISRKVWELDQDFQGFVCVGGQMRLMGTVPEPGVANRHRMQVDSDVDEVEVDPNATWNMYLDIPLNTPESQIFHLCNSFFRFHAYIMTRFFEVAQPAFY
ncbi:hypothetical protein BDZ97DRAFT_1768983 [Flammula alnicola]|nr:hypothetical protein BDZ97DRAFT_1768983 [Flammula alnicola]